MPHLIAFAYAAIHLSNIFLTVSPSVSLHPLKSAAAQRTIAQRKRISLGYPANYDTEMRSVSYFVALSVVGSLLPSSSFLLGWRKGVAARGEDLEGLGSEVRRLWRW
jgi:hypothetical protein